MIAIRGGATYSIGELKDMFDDYIEQLEPEEYTIDSYDNYIYIFLKIGGRIYNIVTHDIRYSSKCLIRRSIHFSDFQTVNVIHCEIDFLFDDFGKRFLKFKKVLDDRHNELICAQNIMLN